MPRTTERIQELRRRRQGRYFDLCREAGACDASSNGRELTGDDLRDLDQVSRDLGKSERMLADDLNAASRFHVLTRQVADDEDQKPAAVKAVATIEVRLEDVRSRVKENGGIIVCGKNHKTSVALQSELLSLQDEHRQAHARLGQSEAGKREINSLVAANPWLRVVKEKV